MKFAPKTDKELQEVNLVPEGFYNFEVLKAEEKVSSKGNPMLELQLKIKDANNRDRVVFDRLMEAFSHKLKSFCKSTGLTQRYDDGELNEHDCKFKSGRLHLIVEPEKNVNGQVFKAKNAVKEYYSLDDTKSSELVSDDVPF